MGRQFKLASTIKQIIYIAIVRLRNYAEMTESTGAGRICGHAGRWKSFPLYEAELENQSVRGLVDNSFGHRLG
jgi:hypothetical protein